MRTLQKFEGKIQVYLPDLKYSDGEAAEKYSGAPDYPETAKAALLEMFRQTGPCRFDENGMLLSGLLIRHLILPSNLKNTFGVIDWVADTFPKGEVLFSHDEPVYPPGGLSGFQEISRRVSRPGIRKSREYLFQRGSRTALYKSFPLQAGNICRLRSFGRRIKNQKTVSSPKRFDTVFFFNTTG